MKAMDHGSLYAEEWNWLITMPMIIVKFGHVAVHEDYVGLVNRVIHHHCRVAAAGHAVGGSRIL